ncbi:MAG TPA: AI-2E family transporter [Edaphobacter sp.]
MPESVTEKEEKTASQNVRGHILFTIGVLLLLALAWVVLKELMIVYVSALFAAVLMPAVNSISERGIRGYHPSRPVAIIILLFSGALIFSLFFFVGLPPVVRDLSRFAEDLPRQIPDLVARFHNLPFVSRLNVEAIAARAESALTATATYLLTSLPQWLSHVFDILTAVFLCIYFMLEGEHAYRFFLSLFPRESRLRLDATLQRANQKISKWLLGQGLLMLILGISSTIVFGLLHVRYFILLGFLMGLFNIIPVAGGIITITIAAIVAAVDSWTKVLGVLIFYIVYVNLENVYLVPRIMRSSVHLMGLTILVSLVFGTALAGIVGALVAVPTAALLSVLLEEYAVQKDAG